MGQTFHTKASSDLDELIGWMERFVSEIFEYQGERWRRHIDQFQIVPLPGRKFQCIVMSSEFPVLSGEE